MAVDFSTDSAGLESSEFPEPTFSRMYMGNDLAFPGTFYGLAGTYECTAPPCEVSTGNDGAMSSTDAWTFTPDVPDGAMIDLPDGGLPVFRLVAERAGRSGRRLRGSEPSRADPIRS